MPPIYNQIIQYYEYYECPHRFYDCVIILPVERINPRNNTTDDNGNLFVITR